MVLCLAAILVQYCPVLFSPLGHHRHGHGRADKPVVRQPYSCCRHRTPLARSIYSDVVCDTPANAQKKKAQSNVAKVKRGRCARQTVLMSTHINYQTENRYIEKDAAQKQDVTSKHYGNVHANFHASVSQNNECEDRSSSGMCSPLTRPRAQRTAQRAIFLTHNR